jgi:hypothetical protein
VKTRCRLAIRLCMCSLQQIKQYPVHNHWTICLWTTRSCLTWHAPHKTHNVTCQCNTAGTHLEERDARLEHARGALSSTRAAVARQFHHFLGRRIPLEQARSISALQPDQAQLKELQWCAPALMRCVKRCPVISRSEPGAAASRGRAGLTWRDLCVLQQPRLAQHHGARPPLGFQAASWMSDLAPRHGHAATALLQPPAP